MKLNRLSEYTETELRQFIEGDDKIIAEYADDSEGNGGYSITIVSPVYDEKVLNEYSSNETDLLEAYRDVVAQILNEDKATS